VIPPLASCLLSLIFFVHVIPLFIGILVSLSLLLCHRPVILPSPRMKIPPYFATGRSFFIYSRCPGAFQGVYYSVLCPLLFFYRGSPTINYFAGILEMTLLACLKALWSKSANLDIYGHMIVPFFIA
jgi:hypothetical protein